MIYLKNSIFKKKQKKQNLLIDFAVYLAYWLVKNMTDNNAKLITLCLYQCLIWE